MKYQTADYIRSFVYALSCESGNDSLGVACRERGHNSDEWEVCLYSKITGESELFEFVLLAKAICGLVPTLVMYGGLYNKATYGEDLVDAVIIW